MEPIRLSHNSLLTLNNKEASLNNMPLEIIHEIIKNIPFDIPYLLQVNKKFLLASQPFLQKVYQSHFHTLLGYQSNFTQHHLNLLDARIGEMNLRNQLSRDHQKKIYHYHLAFSKRMQALQLLEIKIKKLIVQKDLLIKNQTTLNFNKIKSHEKQIAKSAKKIAKFVKITQAMKRSLFSLIRGFNDRLLSQIRNYKEEIVDPSLKIQVYYGLPTIEQNAEEIYSGNLESLFLYKEQLRYTNWSDPFRKIDQIIEGIKFPSPSKILKFKDSAALIHSLQRLTLIQLPTFAKDQKSHQDFPFMETSDNEIVKVDLQNYILYTFEKGKESTTLISFNLKQQQYTPLITFPKTSSVQFQKKHLIVQDQHTSSLKIYQLNPFKELKTLLLKDEEVILKVKEDVYFKWIQTEKDGKHLAEIKAYQLENDQLIQTYAMQMDKFLQTKRVKLYVKKHFLTLIEKSGNLAHITFFDTLKGRVIAHTHLTHILGTIRVDEQGIFMRSLFKGRFHYFMHIPFTRKFIFNDTSPAFPSMF